MNEKRAPARSRFALVAGTLIVGLTTVFAYAAQQALRDDSLEGRNPGVAVFDPKTQAVAERVLGAHLREQDAERGFAIVADPETGEVLAAANLVRKGKPRSGAWSLSERFEPASVMKALVVATAVEQKAARLDELFDCGKGSYAVGGVTHHDHKKFDRLTATDTVVLSSNICAIRVAERLGFEKLQSMLRTFGLGAGGSAREFPEARPGILPVADASSTATQQDFVAEGYTNVLVTPLEMVQAIGAIANGGTLLKPQPWGTKQPSPIRRVLSGETASKMKQVLREVVVRGTGTPAESASYQLSGKTGTGFHPLEKDHGVFTGYGSVAHFVGFAPFEHPKLVIYAKVIGPKGKQFTGGRVAGSLFKKLAEEILHDQGIAPDQPR